MRRLICFAIFILTCAPQLLRAQAVPTLGVAEMYDRIKGTSILRTDTMQVGRNLSIEVEAVIDTAPAASAPLIGIFFHGTWASWRFLDSRDLDFLLDDSVRMSLGALGHDGSVSPQGYIIELLSGFVHLDTLRRIASANKVEGRLGPVDFVLQPYHLATLRLFLSRLAARPTYSASDMGAMQGYLPFQVDEEADPDLENPRPKYPKQLKNAGVEGQVIAQFIVDTTGRIDMTTVKILQSIDPLCTSAVMAVLPRLRYSPAKRNGSKVRMQVRRYFLFSPRL